MDQKFQQFKTSVIGQFIEREDNSNYAQCFDLAFAWCDFLGIPRDTIRHRYAYQIFTQPTEKTKQYFDIIPNSPNNIPQVGAIVVFGTVVGVAGHVSIETGKSNIKDCLTLDQNWGTPLSVKEVTHPLYKGVLGWLQPKMMPPVSQNDQIIAIKAILYSSVSPQEKIDKMYKIFG